MRQWHPIMKSRASIYLLILGAAAIGGLRSPAVAEGASSGITVLQWQARNNTDQMTDKTTREAVAGAAFDAGITLEAHASCNQIGMEFRFDTFKGREPAPFTQSNDGIVMRVRIGDAAVRTAEAKANYTNEADVEFFDPVTTEKLISGAYPGGKNPTDILAPFNNAMTETLMDAARKAAPGTLQQLAVAQSIRVELSLASGGSYVVDLDPQDDALRTIVQGCVVDLQSKVNEEARRRAEVRQREQQRQNELALRQKFCSPNKDMVVIQKGVSLRSLNELDPRTPRGSVRTWEIPVGTRVLVEIDSELRLPPGATVPIDRCVVIYEGPRGLVVGTVPVGALTTVSAYHKAHPNACICSAGRMDISGHCHYCER